MGFNLEALQAKKARMSGTTWTPNPGENRIRLLPPGMGYFRGELNEIAVEYRSHWLRQEGYDTVVCRCPRDKREHCLACEVAGKYRDSPDAGFADLAQQVRVSMRYLMWIFDMSKPTEGIQPYECGPMVFNRILDFASNPSWVEGIASPTEGHDLILTLTPGSQTTSGFNAYAVLPEPNKTSILDQLPKDWMDTLDTLSTHIVPYVDEEEMRKILNRMGFPLEAPEPTPAAAAPAVAPTTTAAPTEAVPTEVPATETSLSVTAEAPAEVEPVATGEVAEAAPVVEAAPGGATEKAQARAAQKKGPIVEPPATAEDQTPTCFGSYDPLEHPCDDCAVRTDCQRALVGIV